MGVPESEGSKWRSEHQARGAQAPVRLVAAARARGQGAGGGTHVLLREEGAFCLRGAHGEHLKDAIRR
jgi:hypothetical protein